MKGFSFSNRFKYIFSFTFIILFLVSSLGAQVDKAEIENLGPVIFINYEGPHSRIETRAQIRAIGYNLGQAVKAGSSRTGAQGRYFVIHSAGAPDGFKLDADIFGLGPDVGVDHIRNLRFIIQGYLEAAYNYTERDAALLAEYITVYNAVYRGDWGYFNSRYKTPVMSNLVKEKSGLSLRYDEWPGQTLLLIPLGTGSGGPLSSVDTTSITDSRVTEQLRQEPGMSIDQRKDMVDLKEREADDANQQAAIRREAIQQEEQRIAREKQEAQQREEQARQAQQRAAQEQQRAAQEQQRAAQEQQRIEQQRQQQGADQAALEAQQQEAQRRQEEARRQQEEAQRQQEEAARNQDAAKQSQEDLDKQQQELDTQKKQADTDESFAQQKDAEAQQERQQIAGDQQTLIGQTPPSQASGVLGVAILTADSYLGRLVKLDPGTLTETLRSPLNTVNVRTVTQIGDRFFAIAGENRGSGAIRLVEINGNTLEMQKQGDDDIAPNSLLWASGQDIYAVNASGGKFYMARFNTDLALQTRSVITVHPFASVFFNNGTLITQKEDGSAALLNPSDLTEKK